MNEFHGIQLLYSHGKIYYFMSNILIYLNKTPFKEIDRFFQS